ncbi:hypothetical protein FNH22_03755 [Fulvivirga sp. M361]|uniref:MauE/DoxX family redox-associated membrane protein n=1 Tax=Fulvivirga sp. M361 TaxID=2594266 RepID=UPI00117A46B7|nr:MauE/DoxX family redox-associated membrane protein [Fulvivirga sp. M361]TRX61180.1 hypothetical protein FNH22_03755 [Fulvivirga sp. M361]
MKKQIVVEIVCFLFILLFTYAAVAKLLEYQKFVVQIGQSPLLTNYAGFLAWAVPAIELIIAVALVITRFRQIALYAAFTLMVLFTAYIVAILQLGKNIPCSCGGILDSMGWIEHLIFNSIYVVLGLIGILLYSNEESSQKKEKKPSMV